MAPKPDSTCYEYVLDTCIAAGAKDTALKTFTAMEQRGIEPTEKMYAALVRGFGDALELESALGVSSITCSFLFFEVFDAMCFSVAQ
jgi:Pentatricopeptide repeat domain